MPRRKKVDIEAEQVKVVDVPVQPLKKTPICFAPGDIVRVRADGERHHYTVMEVRWTQAGVDYVVRSDSFERIVMCGGDLVKIEKGGGAIPYVSA